MSDPIKVGDLVQVVRWPCCGSGLGGIFIVDHFKTSGNQHLCMNCWKEIPAHFAMGPGSPETRCGAPPEWLKRIPPLDELEGKLTEEQQRVPNRMQQA